MAVFKNLLVFGRTSISLLKPRHIVKTVKANLSVNSRNCAAYDPDGKTTVNILNHEENAPLMVDKYSYYGFRLNNGIFVVGPVAMFPQSVLSWNIKDDHDINERSLSLFLHLAPQLDVLVIGLSDPRDQKLLINTRKRVYEILKARSSRMNIEVLPTEKAVTTFNFLNCERRFVGAAMLPPTFYSPTLDDEFVVEYLSKKKDMLKMLPDDITDKLKPT